MEQIQNDGFFEAESDTNCTCLVFCTFKFIHPRNKIEDILIEKLLQLKICRLTLG